MKNTAKTFVISLFTLLLCLGQTAMAGDLEELQRGWEHANYVVTGKDQQAEFETLVARADELIAARPDSAELLIWQAIIKSTWAGYKGGLGALGLCKDARRSLEKALSIDETALAGSAYTSLGALYYQVPGWPLAFGSDKKARKLLEQAIAMNPDGIDSNYFYGDFLIHEKEYDKARVVLEKAMQAAPRDGREVADDGRRKEINELLQKLDEKQKS